VKIFIVYASAGHGHKKVAEAIHQEFKDHSADPIDVRLIDMLDYAPAFFRRWYPLTYFLLVKYAPAFWGWCYHLVNHKIVLSLLNPFRFWMNRLHSKRLTELVVKEKPDWIINTHFLFPTVVGPMIEKQEIPTRMITVVTDFKVHSFWIHRGSELFVGMAETTRQNLIEWGVPDEKIVLWGIPVHPRFRKHLGRHLLLKELGLDETRSTVLITSGSFGIGPTEKILEVLAPLAPKIQTLVVTGTNQGLLKRLQSQNYPYPVHALGYVTNMDHLMEVSDLAIVKPGGSTVCELLVKACPFLMLEPIPGQEEGNGEVLILEGISQYLIHPEDLLTKWPELEDPESAKRLRSAIMSFARPEAGLRIVEFINAQISR